MSAFWYCFIELFGVLFKCMTGKIIKIFLIILFLILAKNTKAANDLSGMILLDVERNGEAWYVYPDNNKRYYLGRPKDAFDVMRNLGLGISEHNFQKIAQAGLDVSGDIELAKKLAGKIIIQTERNGEAWYVYPKDLKKYYLGRPEDAFEIMRKLGLGISRKNLASIHKLGYNESLDQYSKYYFKKEFVINYKNFYADIVEIDLRNPNLLIITDAAQPYPEKNVTKNFGGKALIDFVSENNGFAAMNGTYFCAYASCGNMNYYFYPIYTSVDKVMVNESELKYWTTGPIMAFDENNKFYYFKDSRDFVSRENFENKFGVKLQAAIGNKPRLIENYQNLLIDWDLDEKQKTAKHYRNAIAYKDNKIYLIIVRDATVPDLAEIVKKMEVEYALNMDGGYSSALFYNDEYMIGPGRNIPNAIIFSEKK